MDIVAHLQSIKDCVGKTTLHKLNRIIATMLAMTERVTMLGISRWAGDGVVIVRSSGFTPQPSPLFHSAVATRVVYHLEEHLIFKGSKL